MRHAAKRDDTEPGIVKALELAGWTVVKVSDTGFPDLACFRRGVVRFLECKGPNGKMTPAQEQTFRRIEGALVTVHVVRTPEEALMAVGAPVEDILKPLAKTMPLAEMQKAIDKARAAGIEVRALGVEGVLPPLEQNPNVYSESETERFGRGHLVTPAYQQAQTAAVVPPKRKKR